MKRPALALWLTLCSCVSPALATAAVLDRLEATVNSSLILLSDVRKFRETVGLRSQLDPLFANTSIAAQGSSARDQDVVAFLVDEKLITQAFPVTDAEVEQEINSIQSANHIDRAALKNALRDQGYSFEEYFELIRISAAKRNLIDRDIRTRVTISDDDIKNYFYNHYSRSAAAPTSYKVNVITLLRPNYKSPAAMREIAGRALEAIKAGEAFAEVARRFSDDPSKESGGDLGTLTTDQLSPAFKEQLKKLEIGQVSEIFGNPNQALFILKLVDIGSDEGERMAKMKDEIRNHLLTQEYQHQIQLWLERQRQNAFIHRAGEPSVSPAPGSAA